MDRIKQLFSLEGYRIIVTGASSGLGLSIAVMLAECGATVFGFSRSGQIKTDISHDIPQNFTIEKLDVRDRKKVKQHFVNIGENGGIDGLINNAGVTIRKKTTEITSEDWEYVNQINVKAVFQCSQLAYPYLKKSKYVGRIINISSMASYLGFSEVAPYNASKSAVLGITKALAVEWANDNILVNSVSPGWFPSEMSQQVLDEDRAKKILNRMPLHRFGKPEELAPMVCFLVSPSATYITGQDFSVDGGALAFGF